MDITRYLDDIKIAQYALENSKLDTIVQGRTLLCEIYSIPAHQHQSFYAQIYDGEAYTILYAKPYISDYHGHNIAMCLFADAIKADKHPAKKGDIYCGIKHVPKDNKIVSMLTECLPKHDEIASVNGFIIDGVFTLIRNNQTVSPALLAYKTIDTISVNRYTDVQKAFLEDAYIYIESIIGNILDSTHSRSANEWFFLARLTDKQYHDAWGG